MHLSCSVQCPPLLTEGFLLSISNLDNATGSLLGNDLKCFSDAFPFYVFKTNPGRSAQDCSLPFPWRSSASQAFSPCVQGTSWWGLVNWHSEPLVQQLLMCPHPFLCCPSKWVAHRAGGSQGSVFNPSAVPGGLSYAFNVLSKNTA